MAVPGHSHKEIRDYQHTNSLKHIYQRNAIILGIQIFTFKILIRIKMATNISWKIRCVDWNIAAESNVRSDY
jgi:hypothetical protein